LSTENNKLAAGMADDSTKNVPQKAPADLPNEKISTPAGSKIEEAPAAPKELKIKKIVEKKVVEQSQRVSQKIELAVPKKVASKKTSKVATIPQSETQAHKSTKRKAGKPTEQEVQVSSEKIVLKAPSGAKKKDKKNLLKKIAFQLRYHTRVGENIFVTGDHALLGENDMNKALPLQYLNEDYWFGELAIPGEQQLAKPISYKYFVRDEYGNINTELGSDKVIDPSLYQVEEIRLIDSWSYAGYYENTFFTEPFKNVLLKDRLANIPAPEPQLYTHTFRIKAPLLLKNQAIGLYGSVEELGKWDVLKPVLMSRKGGEDWWTVNLDLSSASYPITYKYGVYEVSSKEFVRLEGGTNRVVYGGANPNKLSVLSDGFAVLPNSGFKGAGVAIPVFSLRSEESLGVGEFNDMKLLVDWARHIGLKVIQILPVNDTIATHTWSDSYPYAAISAFALHPIFLHLPLVVSEENRNLLQELEAVKEELNVLDKVDYERALNTKLQFVKKIYGSQKDAAFASDYFKSFFQENSHWLVPYAAFSYLRDEFGTPDFSSWPKFSQYNEDEVRNLASSPSTAIDEIGIHYFTQFHLHLQLKAATEYAHQNGIIVKGDIPIGIYRNSSDAWQEPGLYNMDKQAGAPPDDFAVKGQNWGFPTYNWQRMQQDGFAWWKKRFSQMSYYFDAFRIDHILGFFRIWSIPMHAVEGIMGRFVPALPVHINELHDRGIHIDLSRLTTPYINEGILWEVFGELNEQVKSAYLEVTGNGHYALKPSFDTQRKVEAHFDALTPGIENDRIKTGLFELISNVILFEAENSDGQQFHFRIAMENTPSFRYLDGWLQDKLKELYVNYFFRRQDHYWMEEAMHKLPELKRSTNMLICGEDLGMVPDCVPGVMKQLGILSLEIQRMPKDPKKEFFHPNDAPYLSVVTPSTHDMSTIRGWWEEDPSKTQRFYNHQLGKWGKAPFFCEPEINTAIVIQHLYSPAMWSIFQLQDLLGMDGSLRRNNPADERINVPANPKHYWQYRMHMSLEDLINEDGFNDTLRGYVTASGRAE
jgi:4-alpha-glucanotransferase